MTAVSDSPPHVFIELHHKELSKHSITAGLVKQGAPYTSQGQSIQSRAEKQGSFKGFFAVALVAHYQIHNA